MKYELFDIGKAIQNASRHDRVSFARIIDAVLVEMANSAEQSAKASEPPYEQASEPLDDETLFAPTAAALRERLRVATLERDMRTLEVERLQRETDKLHQECSEYVCQRDRAREELTRVCALRAKDNKQVHALQTELGIAKHEIERAEYERDVARSRLQQEQQAHWATIRKLETAEKALHLYSYPITAAPDSDG